MPTHERRRDLSARDRLGELQRAYEVFARRVLVALVVLFLAVVVSFAVQGLLIAANGERATEARNLAVQIQAQRAEFCRDQNANHDATYNALVRAAKVDENNRKTAAGKAEVRRRRDVTLGLIDALAPHRDCKAALGSTP